jgi:hypothetical protein
VFPHATIIRLKVKKESRSFSTPLLQDIVEATLTASTATKVSMMGLLGVSATAEDRSHGRSVRPGCSLWRTGRVEGTGFAGTIESWPQALLRNLRAARCQACTLTRRNKREPVEEQVPRTSAPMCPRGCCFLFVLLGNTSSAREPPFGVQAWHSQGQARRLRSRFAAKRRFSGALRTRFGEPVIKPCKGGIRFVLYQTPTRVSL